MSCRQRQRRVWLRMIPVVLPLRPLLFVQALMLRGVLWGNHPLYRRKKLVLRTWGVDVHAPTFVNKAVAASCCSAPSE